MQEGPRSGGGDAAAAERCLALVVAAIADCRQTDDQSAAKISDPCIDHHAVFPPRNAHFDEGSAGGKSWKGEKESKF